MDIRQTHLAGQMWSSQNPPRLIELHPVNETQNKKAPLWLKRTGTLPDKVSVSFLIVSFHS
jgi:hypothetical protein